MTVLRSLAADAIEEGWYPAIDAAVCTGCGQCIPACPTGALAMSDGVAVLALPDQCAYCAVCEDVCPVDAITLPYLITMESGA